ncbi:hypothetical protein ACOMHN_066599 [Nucella lapillus]
MLQPQRQRAEIVNYLVKHIGCMTHMHKNAEIFKPKFVMEESEDEKTERRSRFDQEGRYRQTAGEVFVTSGCAAEMCVTVNEAMYSLSRTCVIASSVSGRAPKNNDAVKTGVDALKTLLGFTSQCDVVRKVVLRHPLLTSQSLVVRTRQLVEEHLDGSLVSFETFYLTGFLELLYSLSEDEGGSGLLRAQGALQLCRRLLYSSSDEDVR